MSVPKIGEIVENFEILKDLGKGGMGQVYLAIDQKLSRKVALKFLGHENQDTPPHLMARFEKEAKALAALSHPNIVNIHFFGNYKGTSFLVMEYVEGGTLADILDTGAFGVDETIESMKGVLLGLGEAHKKGILHRDIKPENILIDVKGNIKIVDFGICKNVDEKGERITKDNLLVGTASYMSPESIQFGGATPSSDIFSLGVVFYELIVGAHPFLENSTASRMIRICNDLIKFPRDFYDLVPPGLPQLIEKMTALRADERYQETESILEDLKNLGTVSIPGFGSIELGEEAVFDSLKDVQDSLLQGGYDLDEAEKIMEVAQSNDDIDSNEIEIQVAAIMAGTDEPILEGESSIRQRDRPLSKNKIEVAKKRIDENQKKIVMPPTLMKTRRFDLQAFLEPLILRPKLTFIGGIVVLALVLWSQRAEFAPYFLSSTISSIKNYFSDVKRSLSSVPVARPQPLQKGNVIKIRRVRENTQTGKALFDVVDELQILSSSGDIFFSKLKDGETQKESVLQFARNPFLPPLRNVSRGQFDIKSVIIESEKNIFPLKVGRRFDFLYNITNDGQEKQFSRTCEVKLRESIQDTEVFKVTCTTRSRGREQVSDIFYSPSHNLILREVQSIKENGHSFKETQEIIDL